MILLSQDETRAKFQHFVDCINNEKFIVLISTFQGVLENKLIHANTSFQFPDVNDVLKVITACNLDKESI